MKSAVEKKEIIIVGGHTNWINKVQKSFPNWSIIPANASRTVDTNIFSGKEHVYFFTDYLDHSTYGKYIVIYREKIDSFRIYSWCKHRNNDSTDLRKYLFENSFFCNKNVFDVYIEIDRM